jgi:3-hydroxyacyl-CoA dehydrogenase
VTAPFERAAIAGSGTIATGLAACASAVGPVHLLARSEASALRAEEAVRSACSKTEGADADNVRVTTEIGDIAECDVVVEAIIEDLQTKAELIAELGVASPDAALATTTSALGIEDLGERSGCSVSTSSTPWRRWSLSSSAFLMHSLPRSAFEP